MLDKRHAKSGAAVTAKGNARREKILDTAFHLVSTRGIGALSYEGIASKLNLTKTHVKYYFQTKDDLLLSCFERVAEIAQLETIQAVEKAYGWENQLFAVIHGAFSWAKNNEKHFNIIFLFYHYCTVNKSLADKHQKTRDIGRARMRDIIKNGAQLSLNKADQIAFEIQMHLTAVLLELANTNRLDLLDEYEKQVLKFVKSRLSAI